MKNRSRNPKVLPWGPGLTWSKSGKVSKLNKIESGTNCLQCFGDRKGINAVKASASEPLGILSWRLI